MPLLGLLGGASATSTAKLVAQGNAAYAQGKLDEALALYDEASVASPESPQLHFNRGTVHYKKEDFAEAIDSFKQAALRSKDPDLGARAKYNLGNCAFLNGQRQRDSDLKKAIEHCQESISYYQEAHGMDSEFSQAAENIEIVRLYVKTLLDEQKKKQEQEQQQQEQQDDLVKKLKELIKQQNSLMSENEALRVARPAATDPPAAEAWQKALDALTGKESTLRGDTGKILVEMRQSIEQIRQQAAGGGATPGGGSPPGPAAHPDAAGFAEKLELASGHVGNAMADEQLAEDHLAQAKQVSALAHQANAVADLEEAVKVLSEEQQQQDQQDQQQSDDQQQDQEQDQEPQEGDEQQDQENKEQQEGDPEDQQQQNQSQGEESEEDQ